MKKYSEDKEENLWDDDFIFDAPVATKRRGSGAPCMTSHLSVSTSTISKDKRKSSTSTWSTAFKKIGPDPRQTRTSSTSASSKKTSAKSANSTTTTTTTAASKAAVIPSHRTAPPLSANEEFAFFDSDDMVGFGKTGAAPKAVRPVSDASTVGSVLAGLGILDRESSPALSPVNSRQSGRYSARSSGKLSAASFDEGLDGDNLGFGDEDFIPNVGFDDSEEEEEGTTLDAPAVHSARPSITTSISSWNSNNSSRNNSAPPSPQHHKPSAASKLFPPMNAASAPAAGPARPVIPRLDKISSFADTAVPTNASHSRDTSDQTPRLGGLPGAHQHQNHQKQQLHSLNEHQHQHHHHHHHNRHGGRSAPSVASSATGSSSSGNGTGSTMKEALEKQLDEMIESDEPLSFEVLDSISHSNSHSQKHGLSSNMSSLREGSIASFGWEPQQRVRQGVRRSEARSAMQAPPSYDSAVGSAAAAPPSYYDSVTASSHSKHIAAPLSSAAKDRHVAPSTAPPPAYNTISPGLGTSTRKMYTYIAPLPVSDDSSDDWNSASGRSLAQSLAQRSVSTKASSSRRDNSNSSAPVSALSSPRDRVFEKKVYIHPDDSDTSSDDLQMSVQAPSLYSTSHSASHSRAAAHSSAASSNHSSSGVRSSGVSTGHRRHPGTGLVGSDDPSDFDEGLEDEEHDLNTEGLTLEHSAPGLEDWESEGDSFDSDSHSGSGSGSGSEGGRALTERSERTEKSGRTEHTLVTMATMRTFGTEAASDGRVHGYESSDSEDVDWDLDLEPPSGAEALHANSAQTYKEILTGRVTGQVNEEDETSVTERESLLDFLRSTVQKTVFPPSLSDQPSPTNKRPLSAAELLNMSRDSAEGDSDEYRYGPDSVRRRRSGNDFNGASIPKSTSTPSISSRSYNNEVYEEEGHNVETANPHLRGLLDWVDATTLSFHAVLTAANSSKEQNARTLLQAEVALPPGDEYFMDKLLERCEHAPTSDSCIYTLEVVSKWLRGMCNLHHSIMGALQASTPPATAEHHTFDAENRINSTSSATGAGAAFKLRRTSSLGESRLGSAPRPRAKHEKFFGNVSSRRIDRIYDWCDDILQEQLVATTSSLGNSYRRLLEINTRGAGRSGPAGSGYGYLSGVSHQVPSQSNNSHWASMGMVAIKDSAHPASAAPAPVFGSLRNISSPSDDDQLVLEAFRLSSNLMSLYRLQINMLEIRIHLYDSFELVACMELLQKISEELEKVATTLLAALRRMLPAPESCTADQLARRTHLDTLTAIANDLVGCCFAIKVAAICCVSPINFQPLPPSCQRITSNIHDIAKITSNDYGMMGDDMFTKNGTAVATKAYNVIYELTLGSHFLELMLSIPSPSIVRAKLYLAAYTYLQRLKKKELPWQSKGYKLVSIKQHLDSFANFFNLYQQGTDAFGLNYSDMDNNSFTLTLAEVEGSIIQSFAEVFGSLDQHRIVQLLLFESANELLPTAPRDYTEAAAFLHRPSAAVGQGHMNLDDAGLPVNENCDSEGSDLNQDGAHCWSAFTTMKGAFRHIPAALNLDNSIQLERRKWTSMHSPGSAGASANSPSGSSSSPKGQRSFTECAELTPTRPKAKPLSFSARYELFNFGNQVLFKLAQSIVEMSPNVALDVYQMCILILGHLRHSQEKGKVEKVAVMLAVKVGRRDAAIWHGESVLKFLQRRGDNINEMLYMTDLLAAQYSENAQYELAAKALFSAISVLNQRNKIGNMNRHSGSASVGGSGRYSAGITNKDSPALLQQVSGSSDAATSTMEFERALDPLLLKLGKLLLQFGSPDRAADTFQVLLSSLCERTDCLANDAKKVTVLSWLTEAYLQLEDFATCKSVIKTIKLVRAAKLHKATATALGGPAQGSGGNSARVSGKSGKRTPNNNSPTNSTTLAALQRTYSRLSRSASRDLRGEISTYGDFSESPRPQSSKDRLLTGIATGSNDSFEFDSGDKDKDKAGSVKAPSNTVPPVPQPRPLPPTPQTIGSGSRESMYATTFTSPMESGALRSRPLPPTPRDAMLITPRTAEAQALHSRPLPPTPLEKKLSESSMGDPSAAENRRSVTLHPAHGTVSSVFASRPLSTGAYKAIDGSNKTPDVGHKIVVPSSAATSEGRDGAQLMKRRKSRVLKLQPLETTGSAFNFTDESDMSPAVAPTATAKARPQIPLLNTPLAVQRNQGGAATPTAPAAVNSIFLHYLRNPPEANLPQFCATSDDLDLGHLQARLLFKNKKYASALKSLLPTMIGVELLVIGIDGTAGPAGWSRQALMELGELYYLRGKIQMEAASSCADVSFPIHLGTSQLFEKVCALLSVGDFALSKREARAQRSAADSPGVLRANTGPRRYVRTTKRKTGSKAPGVRTPRDAAAADRDRAAADNRAPADGLSLTCTEAVKYSCPADLCWDAMAWFRRAKDIARLAGDELGGALAANRLAMNHLMPMFVPHALFRVPLERARDLSPQAVDPSSTSHWSLSRKDYPAVQRQRLASLTEVQHVMESALDIHLHTCLPLPLMDAYLNLAEMCFLLGNKTDAISFWMETKELFLHLFADGALIPLLRRASVQFIRKIQALLHRIVRFMWTLDQATANAGLLLLDMQIILSHETERVVRRNAVKASGVSSWLPEVLERVLPPAVSAAGTPVKPAISMSSANSTRRKRSTISRMSRFFSRLFASSDAKDGSKGEADIAAAPVSTSLKGSNASGAEETSSAKSATNKLLIGLQRMKSSAKSTNSFDSFIERSGFDSQLDVRRFYNLMNADLVLEKVHDYGWSACVEHSQLLKPIDSSFLVGSSDPEASPAHRQNGGGRTAASSITASGDFGAAAGAAAVPTVQLVGTGGVADLDALIVLNERAKAEYELKYQSVAAAYFLYDHILLRGQMMADGDAEGEGLDHPGAAAELSGRSLSADLSKNSPAEIGALLLKASLSPKGPLTKQSSFLGTPRSPLLTVASSSRSGSRSNSFFHVTDTPLDPFADFDWMDESFADYSPHSRSLQARTMLERQNSTQGKVSRSKSKYKRMIMGDAAAQFGTLFMPEFDEAHLFSTEEVKSNSMKHNNTSNHKMGHGHSNPSSASTAVTTFWAADQQSPTVRSRPMPAALNAEYLRDIDRRSETVLIQRTWRCYLLIQNAQWGYRSGRRSLEVLRGDVRSALCSLSLNMVRLRAFSRQYQGSMLEFDRLQQELPMLPAVLDSHGHPHPVEESGKRLERDLLICRDAGTSHASNTTTTADNLRAAKRTLKDYKTRKPVLLQHRLPLFIYAIHIEDNLLLYRPHDGSKNIQKLGGAGFISYNKDTSMDSSAAHADLPGVPPTLTSGALARVASMKEGYPSALGVGIAQVDKKPPPEQRVLEQKFSFLSMVSGSDTTRDSAPVGGQAGLKANSTAVTGRKVNNSIAGSAQPDDSTPRDGATGGSDSAESSQQDILSAQASTAGKLTPRQDGKAKAKAVLLSSSSVTSVSYVPSAKPALRMKETALLYDLVASTTDDACGGGLDKRKRLFSDMKSGAGALTSSLHFIQSVSESAHSPHPQLQAPATAAHAVLPPKVPLAAHGGSGFISESTMSHVPGDVSSSAGTICSSDPSNPEMQHTQAAGSSGDPRVKPLLLSSRVADSMLPVDSSRSSSSYVALSASMSNMLGLFSGSSDSADAKRCGGAADGCADNGDPEDEEEVRRPPSRPVPLTLVSSHSIGALPWEALLLQANVSVVRHLSLLALCGQAYSASYCCIAEAPPSLKVESPVKMVSLARGVVGPLWQQKATYIAVSYGNREFSPTMAQELRALEDSRRSSSASRSIASLLHSTTHIAARAGTTTTGTDAALEAGGDFGGDSRKGSSAKSFRLTSRDAQFRDLANAVETRLVPSASPMFTTERPAPSFFGKHDLVLVGTDTGAYTGQRWPTLARDFWRSLPPPPPLQRSARRLHDSIAVPVPGSAGRGDSGLGSSWGAGSFPLLVLPYVDFIEVSDALAHLISHRPDAVLVFAPLFVIEPLMIEIKLALDRWCKPESVPSPVPSPVRSHAESGGLGAVHRSKSLNSSRGMFSSFLGMSGSSNSSGSGGVEASATSATTFADNSGAVPNSSISSLSLRSAEDMNLLGMGMVASGAGAGATGGKRPALSKIIEETGSSSSHGTPATSFKATSRPSLGSRSRSSDDVDVVESPTGRGIILRTKLSQQPASPDTRPAGAAPATASPSVPVGSKSTNYLGMSFLQSGSGASGAAPQPRKPPQPPPAINTALPVSGPAPAHPVLVSSSWGSSGGTGGASNSTSNSTSRKALRAKERTWVYHAVMGVVQSMQQERGVPIVVFI